MKEQKRDHYLTEEQLENFKRILNDWKIELLKSSEEIISTVLEEKAIEPDAIDSACNISHQAFELRTKDRARKLIHKIDQALGRIEDGTYGYCEETGKPIGLKRLEARPVATLCIEAQEKHEKKERDYREDVI